MDPRIKIMAEEVEALKQQVNNLTKKHEALSELVVETFQALLALSQEFDKLLGSNEI